MKSLVYYNSASACDECSVYMQLTSAVESRCQFISGTSQVLYASMLQNQNKVVISGRSFDHVRTLLSVKDMQCTIVMAQCTVLFCKNI